MFQATTRLILFLVGAVLTAQTLVLGMVGPVIFSAARTSILVLLLWSLLVWFVRRRSYPRDPKTLWVVVFSLALAVSLLMSLLSGHSFTSVVISGLTVGGAIAFALLLAYVISSRRDLDALLGGYLVSVVVTSVSVFLAAGAGIGRSGGLGGDANQFAVETLMAIPIAVLFLYTKTSSRFLWRVFLLVVLGLALGAIVQSVSRTALVAGAGMFGLWVLRFRRFDVLQYVVPAALLIAVGSAVVSEEWTDRMGTMTSREGIEGDSSIMSRFVVGGFALRAFASNPVLGVGYDSFGEWAAKRIRYLRHVDPSVGGSVVKHQAVHSSYLHVMAEMGLSGLIPFLAILILTWKQYSAAWSLARGTRGDPELSRLYLYAIFLQLSFLGQLISGFFLPSLGWKSAWFAIGLSIVVLGLTRQRVMELQAATAQDEPLGLEESGDFGVPELGARRPGDPWPQLR